MHKLLSEDQLDRLVAERTNEQDQLIADLEEKLEKAEETLQKLESNPCELPVLGLVKDQESNAVCIQWTGPHGIVLHLSCPLGDKMGIAEIIDSMIK